MKYPTILDFEENTYRFPSAQGEVLSAAVNAFLTATPKTPMSVDGPTYGPILTLLGKGVSDSVVYDALEKAGHSPFKSGYNGLGKLIQYIGDDVFEADALTIPDVAKQLSAFITNERPNLASYATKLIRLSDAANKISALPPFLKLVTGICVTAAKGEVSWMTHQDSRTPAWSGPGLWLVEVDYESGQSAYFGKNHEIKRSFGGVWHCIDGDHIGPWWTPDSHIKDWEV